MKNKKITIIVLCIIGITFIYMFYYFTSSHANYYNSISRYMENNGGWFYDFYEPVSYFDNNLEKTSMKDKNNIDVYYYNDPKESYQITYSDINGMEVTYFVFQYQKSSQKFKEEYVSKYQEVNINNHKIYYQNTSSMTDVYYYDDGIAVKIRIMGYDEKDNPQNIKDIAISMITDSIKLN